MTVSGYGIVNGWLWGIDPNVEPDRWKVVRDAVPDIPEFLKRGPEPNGYEGLEDLL